MKLIANHIGTQICTFLSLVPCGSLLLLGCLLLSFSIHLDLTGKRRWMTGEGWMGNRGGIGIQPGKSWESWWQGEQEHLKYTTVRGRFLEILLACRFFLYQYGIVYHLHIAHGNQNFWVSMCPYVCARANMCV